MPFDFSNFHARADKTIAVLRDDIATLRTGRATTQLLDSVSIDAYGTKMRVHELAKLSAPDPTLLVVEPWDKSLLSVIEKGIASSGINLHPVVDGSIIRIMVPPLTEERRKEMVKLLHQKIESGRVMMRNVRGDIRKDIEKRKGEAGVSEDDITAEQQDLDIQIKKYMDTIEQMLKDKEKELMKIG